MNGVRRLAPSHPSQSTTTPRLFAAGAAVAFVLVACGSGPSKSQALESIQAGIKEDGSWTLPVDILSMVKMQHATKGICVPKEGADKARACMDALVKANITHRMDETYMGGWPDDVAVASLKDVPAYERRARNLVYSMCVDLAGDLREGRFTGADAHADKILKIVSTDPTHADVTYAREIALRPSVPAIDAACGTVSRPPGDTTVKFAKGDSGWALVPPEAPAAH